MAGTTLELSLVITASTGAAYGALQSLGQNLQRLNARVESAARLHQRLGRQISRIGAATAPVAGLTARYERLGRTIDQARANLDRLAETQRRIESHQRAFGELKGAALGVLGLGAGLAAPVKAAINFEEAFADVRKVVDGSDQELSAFSDKLLGMSRRLPLAATELAALAASGGQLGIKLPDLPAYVETVAKMATAFDMPAEIAGGAMAKLANVFEIPIPRIGRLGDVINQISNETPAKASQIVEALGRIGGTARQFGLTAEQGAALTSAMIALGRSPEVAATSINALLIKLGTADKQGEKFQQALAAIGLSGRRLKAMIAQDAQGALNTFLQRLAQVPKAARAGVLVDLFGTEFADEIAALTGSLGTYQQALAAAGRAQGSMEKEFAARAATTANQLQLLRNNVAELGIAAGSALLPTLNRLIESVRPLIETFADFAKAHPGLIAGIGKLAGLLFAFKAGSLVARAGMHLLSISWLGAVGRLQALRNAWLAASLAFQTRSLAPLLREMAQVSGTLGRLQETWQAFGRAIAARGGIWRALDFTLLRLKYRLLEQTAALRAATLASIQWSRANLLSLAGLRGLVSTGLARIARLLTGLRSGFLAAAVGVRAFSIALLTSPIGWIGAAIAGAALLVWKFWKPVSAFFSGFFSGLKQALNPIAEGFKAAFDPLKALLTPVANLLGKLWNGFKALVAPVEDTGNAARSLGEAVGLAVGKIIRMLLGLPFKLLALPAKMLELGVNIVQALIDGVKSRIAEAGRALTNLGQAIASKFKAFFGIRSPSRLFAWMGQNLSQGLALGIENDLGRVQAAMGKLNQAALPPVANGSLASAQVIPLPGLSARQQRIRQIVEPARLPQPAAQSARVIPLAPHAGVRSRSAAPTITFSPRITVHAAPGQPVEAVRAQVQQAMDLSYEEFRRLMRRYEQETRRRALA